MSLILTRNVGQSILIGSNVKVTIVGINGSQVRLAVNAPRHIEVDRQEIADLKIAQGVSRGAA